MCRQASSEAAFGWTGGFSACIVVDWKRKTSSLGAEIRQLYGSVRKGRLHLFALRVSRLAPTVCRRAAIHLCREVRSNQLVLFGSVL